MNKRIKRKKFKQKIKVLQSAIDRGEDVVKNQLKITLLQQGWIDSADVFIWVRPVLNLSKEEQ